MPNELECGLDVSACCLALFDGCSGASGDDELVHGGSRRGLGRHRDSFEAPRWLQLLDGLIPRMDRPLYTSACVGLAFGAIIWVSSALDVSETSGFPTERAKVTSIKNHGGFFSSCGRGGGQSKDITWQSLSSPLKLPNRFVDNDQCLDTSVGEVWTIVRVIDKSGDVQTFVNPTRTYSEAIHETLIAGGITFALVILGLYARIWWIDRLPRLRRLWRERGRSRD